jgi:uncharacterized FlaG/YvyC family protein
MDVRVVGAAEAAPQQTPPASAQQAGGSDAPSKSVASQVFADEPHLPNGSLTPVVAKLLAGDLPEHVSVNVSYRVEHDPNIIVTVFTDPATGREIAQAPPEVMVQFAQFFDKHSGVTVDRSA